MPKSTESKTDYIAKLEALIDLAHNLKQESDFKQILQIITERARLLFTAEDTGGEITLVKITKTEYDGTSGTIKRAWQETPDGVMNGLEVVFHPDGILNSQTIARNIVSILLNFILFKFEMEASMFKRLTVLMN